MIRWLILAALLWPVAAHADPISIGLFVAPFLGKAAAIFIINYGSAIFFAGVAAYGFNRQRRAKEKARNAYNASLRDRTQMVDLQPDAPRTICLGTVRTVEGVRRRWVSGANSDQLTLIVSFAGHEIDSFITFYFNDQALTLDGSGYVQTAPYQRTAPESRYMTVTLDGTGGAVQVLASVPISGSVTAVQGNGLSGIDYEETALTVSVAGSTVTISGGTAGATASINWQTSAGNSFARIRTYLGTTGQNVGAALAAEYPGKITSTDRFAGIALAVVDLWYDPDIYPQGIPNITALLRGAKVYDPRADSTVAGGSGSQRLATPSTWTFSENPALHAYHYARLANGWAVPAAEIRTADVMAAATACAVSTNFTLRKADASTSVVSLPRFRSGIVIPTDADPQAMMAEIMESMAGRHGWAGGVLRMRAGALGASVWALTPSWVAQRVAADGTPDGSAVVRISNGVERSAKVNRVTGVCVDRDQRYQALAFPAIEDPVLIAAEGQYAAEVEFQAVNHVAHAQHLASIMIRESQASLRMEVLCNLSAFKLELLDVGTVTLPRFGMSGKTMEVIGWRWHPAEGVRLGLAEITADMFTPLPELTGRDPAPDSSLPAPWDVETITGVAVTSGTTALTDGSIITRTRVVWTAAVSQAIRRGGKIEVQYTPAAATLPAGDWPSWIEEGDSTEAIIPGLLRRNYVFRVRAVNSLRVRGKWSAQVRHYVAQSRAPRTFRQASAPAGSVSIEGDTWIDTDDGNKRYVREGGAWVALPLGTGGLDTNAATEVIFDSEAAPVVSRGRGPGAFTTIYQTMLEVSYTNSSGASQVVEASAEAAAVKTSGDGSARLGAALGLSSVDGQEIDGDRFAALVDVTSALGRTVMARGITVPNGSTVYASVFVAVFVNVGTVQVTGDDVNVKLTVIKR